MTVSIRHAKVSGKPAGTDPNRVYGTHWDSDHVVPVATNGEAVAGTSDDVLMTPEKTLAAINANISTSGAALTGANDTNVTIALGGTPATAVLRATSITLGWTGTLAASRGGFGADISAESGVPLFATGTPTFTSTTGTGNFVRASSPTLTNPVVGTQTPLDNSTKAASTAYVDAAVSVTSAGNVPILNHVLFGAT